ncbi:hypothetical protein UPYG_G00219990 [Umbra pygmaea]|uniref:KASH domain-containing protein n=1 Tax=Umbra pygmaea TaxID=75934 RepID=A0ABD0WGA4_UMBPY
MLTCTGIAYCVHMTQQEKQEFKESLEAAQSWIQAVQERLRVNDNTQGPRAALEARLRETEKIHESEHEGRVKVDVVLMTAEALLQKGDEDTRNNTLVKLKDLKALWEETCTYIVHCHSRVEWVWLHWSEYLKAFEEFQMWLISVRHSLDPEVELQLGLKEKLWQLDQQHVLLSDIKSKALLLERLLDEAAGLYSRTEDPSVDQEAQERMQQEYNSIWERAKERLLVLQKIADEHQLYQSCVLKFQSWLVSKTKECNSLTEMDDTTENKLQALQILDDSVASEEQNLQHIEDIAEELQARTSPRGAEVVIEEVEELRLAWQRLRQGLSEAGEGLKSSLDSQIQYQSHCQRLLEDIGQLRDLLQRLNRDLETAREGERTEDSMVGQWRKYTNVKTTLLAEQSQVENLKAQLKELFRFSQDSQHLSDDVLAVVKDYQSVKCHAYKLCGESEIGVRQLLEDPLRSFSQWRQKVSQVLEASADVSEFSHIAKLVQKTERLLKNSLQLQERMSRPQVTRDLLGSVFGSDRAESLLTELGAAQRERELLHQQLIQSKGKLEGLISQTKHFGDTHDSIKTTLSVLRDRLKSADTLQPDILAKKSQSDQLRVIKKDLEDCEAHITALGTLVSNSPTNETQWQILYEDWKGLYKGVRVKVNKSEQNIAEHESFHDSLLNVEKWLMIMRQKLESYHSPAGDWSVDNRQLEAQRALGEFPDKELQLQQTEAQGQRVLERTSMEGQVHIQRDMERLRQSWMALHDLSLNLFRLLNSSSDQPDSDIQKERGQAGTCPGLARELFPGEGGDIIKERDSSSVEAGAPEGSPAEGHGDWFSKSSGRWDGRTGTGAQVEEIQGLRAEAGQGADRQVLGQQLSSGALSQGGSQGSGAGGKRRSREEMVLGGDHSFGVDDVDSFVRSRGYGQGLIDQESGSTEEHRGGTNLRHRGSFTPIQTEDLLMEGRSRTSSQHDPGISFGWQKDSRQNTMAGPGAALSAADYMERRREFKDWLQKENNTLSGILSSKGPLSTKQLSVRQNTLKTLRSRVGRGQEQFQMLLMARAEDTGMEEIRYQWMLYKSKLKDVGDLTALLKVKQGAGDVQEEHTKPAKQKTPGLLYRVCRVALPLWFLLLALLLFAFLLPWMDGGSTCSLANNFARSFNIMLRYEGPPPT